MISFREMMPQDAAEVEKIEQASFAVVASVLLGGSG